MEAIDYARDLIAFDSVSSSSNVPVSDYIEHQLRRLGFEIERLEYSDERGVRKASIVGKLGDGAGGMAYFGHSDVVPADGWTIAGHGPFQPTVKDGRLYGRGSCDMKGSVACMLAAAEKHCYSKLQHPIYFTCTADEEVGYHGARQVAASSRLFRDMVAGQAKSIVGEPTRLEVVHAHKGGCAFTVTSRGRAAHSSTSNGINANLRMIPFLVEMKAIHDELEGNAAWHNHEFDPPTMSWNIGINDHTRAINITPAQSVCTVYFRPMPGQDYSHILDCVRNKAATMGLEFHLHMEAKPLYVPADSPFIKNVLALAERGVASTVGYGTDGGMFGALQNLCVIGPGDIAQAHTSDEWIDLEQLEKGTGLYSEMIEEWCVRA
jgi:acetylornithine deacetylase